MSPFTELATPLTVTPTIWLDYLMLKISLLAKEFVVDSSRIWKLIELGYFPKVGIKKFFHDAVMPTHLGNSQALYIPYQWLRRRIDYIYWPKYYKPDE